MKNSNREKLIVERIKTKIEKRKIIRKRTKATRKWRKKKNECFDACRKTAEETRKVKIKWREMT